MNKTSIKFIVAIFLMLGVSYYSVTLHIENKNLNHILEKASRSILKSENNQKNLIGRMQLQLANDFKLISNNLQLIDSGNKKMNIKEVIGNTNITVFRITEHACDICYDYIMKQIKSFSKGLDPKQVLILVEVKKLREYRSFFKEQNTNVTVYGLEHKLDLLLEDSYAPYFFIVDSTLTIKHLFIPGKEQTEITNKYLLTVKNRYY